MGIISPKSPYLYSVFYWELRSLIAVWTLLIIVSCKKDAPFVISSLPDFVLPVNIEPKTPEELVDQLGCNSCHTGISFDNTTKLKAPDLSHASLRYQPAYLFYYLQNPSKVRNHIGSTRMPDFRFSQEESLALTLYLGNQKEIPGE